MHIVCCPLPCSLPPLEKPQPEPPAKPVDDLEDMYGDLLSHPSGVDGHEYRNKKDMDVLWTSSSLGCHKDHEDTDMDICKGMCLS